ncbi:MAG: hypothetical protein SF162_11080 [bacterium]|nr:hypothetical protein [bacterium]
MSNSPQSHDSNPLSTAERYVRPIPLETGTLPPVPPQRTGVGCWITGLATLVTVIGLIGAGLLLPPFNLLERLNNTQFVMLSAQANAVAADGLTVLVDPADPGADFGVMLESVPMDSFLRADTGAGEWVAEAFAAQPPNLALQSPVYSVQTTGTMPATVTITLEKPLTVATTDILDVYAWNAARAEWEFVPSHVNAAGAITAVVDAIPGQIALFQAAPVEQPRVLSFVDVTQVLTQEVASISTIVSPAGLQPTLQGTLAGSLAAGFELNAGYLVMPVIRNFADSRAIDPETVTAILSNRQLRSNHASQIAGFAASGYDGVVIDYRDIPVEQRESFSQFMTELGRLTDSAGVQLGIVVPAASVQNGAWDTGAFDWQAIGRAVDFIQITLPVDPNVYAAGADRLVEAMLRWTVGEVERGKLLIGLSAQSVRQSGDDYVAIPFDQALSALGDVRVRAQTNESGIVSPGGQIFAQLDGYRAATGSDPVTGQTFIEYLDEANTPVARMWLMTPDALRYRLDRGTAFTIGGAGFNDLLVEGIADGIYETILNYKLGIPVQQGPTELALRWTIESSGGQISEVFTALNDELIATIAAPDGNYAINVEVVSGDGAAAERGGAAVAVFAPTATPTPLPTATPTPTPAPTSTPNRAAAVANPGASAPGGAAAAAAAPGAGSIVAGQFEYGGHVTGTGTGGAGAMQRAGMNWMKVQLRYAPGMGADAASGMISEAHGRGFKILIGVVGYPNDLAAGGGAYVAQFASFLGGVASLGPDAIEVWNEPNIDREWPAGQISGAAYAEMLRQAYQAIKGANSGVMVISGAPAPTGAEAAYPGRVVNDDRFIREMVAAGAVQWMDCLGVHYNEGIVGPSQRNGDPRDGYYTRYFLGMMDTYWNAVGGQRPLCFTELGYLTPEGFPPLDPFFGWAANTTVAQQAAWLAEAAALASQSGRVRLMIVWNIDFDFYGTDPQAGYAIIRPGGSCPACDTLAAAR